jgi:signal transduction histidine kinase
VKRVLAIVIPLLPFAALAYFTYVPGADRSIALPLFHFYIVTFTTFSAAVISILLATSLGREAAPRHVLAASAFAVVGSVFFSHGLATPGALITRFHPAIAWSAWLTLFGGGALFACASLDGPRGLPRWLPIRGVIVTAAALVLIYSAVAAFTPGVLLAIEDRVNPWHQRTIFYLTLLLWAFSGARLWRIWRATRSRVDGALAFVALWMIAATISMHQYPVWNLSWWLYHATLLCGFLFIVAVLAQGYEQVRQFRLRRYYLALSLIITALLALIASALFTRFSYDTLVAEITSSSRSIANNLAMSIARDLPDIATPGDLRSMANRSGVRAVFALRLTGLPIQTILVYDDAGVAAYASEPEWIGVRVQVGASYAAALGGETVSTLREPGDPPATYRPRDEVHIIESYAPIRPAGSETSPPIGVLVTVQEAPELGTATVSARVTGLLTAAVTMGLLFLALFTVVSRADHIITVRADELARAYAGLQQAEAMRDDLTYMIVHDLRNPLTAVSASLDFLSKLAGDNTEIRSRMVTNAQSASYRMMGMIEDLLTMSKIEAGEFKLRRQEVDLSELVGNALNTFGAQSVGEGKSLTAECPPGLMASLDPPLIRRVLENLIGNALKYTETDGGRVAVLVQRSPDRVTITVRDNGHGVPDAQKARIFEKFVQLSRDGSPPARQGAGLGLAFCGMVVQQHGGEIKVLDAPEGGSDFMFWIPAQEGGMLRSGG